jgi:chromosome partitioning protein
VDETTLRGLRQTAGLRPGPFRAELNRRLGRSDDAARFARWEAGKEAVPETVARAATEIAQGVPRRARVLAIANQKGGVGKTTSALNLAGALAHRGERVLLIDMDPQATATFGLFANGSIALHRQGRTMANVILQGTPITDAIVPAGTAVEGRTAPCDVASSHIDLSETDGRREPGFDAALREAVEGIGLRYDVIIVDAPPNLGMLTWQSLAAADDVIIPVRTEPYDAMGVGLILQTVAKIQRRTNPSLRLTGVLPTQFNRRKMVDREVLAHLVAVIGEKTDVLEAIPAAALYGHAARDGRIAVEASPSSPAVGPYMRIAAWLCGDGPVPRIDPRMFAQETSE